MTQKVYYFDSSVIVAMLLHQASSTKALQYWQDAEVRVSSRLLLLESTVVIHRFAQRLPENIRAAWVKQSQAWLAQISQSLYIYEIDQAVQELISQEPQFGKARSLDAIHLATAKIICAESSDFRIATFDTGMAALAKSVGLMTVG